MTQLCRRTHHPAREQRGEQRAAQAAHAGRLSARCPTCSPIGLPLYLLICWRIDRFIDRRLRQHGTILAQEARQPNRHIA